MNRAPDPFPLRGRCIGISISAADEGIPPGEDADTFVSQLTLETCSHFLGLGASIALGHQWRAGGILEHLARRAAELRTSIVPPGREGRRAPILNRLAWPDEPPEFNGDRAEWIRDVVEVRQVAPPGIPTDGLTTQSKMGQFARIRALTAMRRELVMASDFRICLGGTGGKPLHRLPGVLEEALLTWEAGKPLYLAGALGGITKALCGVILHSPLASRAREAFHSPPEATALLSEFQATYAFPATEGPSQPGAQFDALAHAERITLEQLSNRAHLSHNDYLTLMTTPDVGKALQLVSLGIANSSPSAR